jgi:hypothetical protein
LEVCRYADYRQPREKKSDSGELGNRILEYL